MLILPHIAPRERFRFTILALLLFINAIIVQSNGVVATSGFIANVGTQQLLIVWALDNGIILLASGAYSLFVDKMKRSTLLLMLFTAAASIYLLLYVLFRIGAPEALTYTLLMILNDQQWILFALAIWALANDIFLISEAKRLFPLLGIAAMIGGIVGNGLAAGLSVLTTSPPVKALAPPYGTTIELNLAQALSTNYDLMLLNALLIALSAGVLAFSLRQIKIVARQDSSKESPLKILREGIEFVRDVPAFRYLASAMLLVGIGLNTIEYQLVISAAGAFPVEGDLSAFYGTFRMVRMISLLVIQGFLAGWILKQISFKSIFVILPTLMFIALFLPIFVPGLFVIAAGEYLARITMEGVDDPARRAFIGMVPDEQRGRVSAFFDGYLYPIGAVLSCLIIGVILIVENAGLIPAGWGQPVYLALIGALVFASLYFVTQMRKGYDESLLSWRLRRRKRGSQLSQLANLDL